MTKCNLLPQLLRRRTVHFQDGPVTVFDGERRPSDFAAQIADSKSEKGDHRPFFVMDTGRIVQLLDTWFAHLPRVQPFYSLKCNADPVLLRLLAAHPSVGFNCCSGEELRNVLEYVSSKRVMCSNPCWTRSALCETDEQNVELLVFESDRDLDRILTNHPNANLLLRVCVNPDSEDPNALFGALPDKCAELLRLCANLGLRCVGIAFSVGSDCICPVVYENAIGWSARLFAIGIEMGLQMEVLNIGGGFASILEEDNHQDQFAELCAGINKSLGLHFPATAFREGHLRILATPGRFFAGSAFSLVTNVIGKRPTDARVVTNNDFDAGNIAFLYQINESYFGTFGCKMVTNCEPHCVPLFQDDDSTADAENVYGAVIGSMGFDDSDSAGGGGGGADIVQSICHFRQLNIGDWLLWANMGAYTFGNCGSLDDSDERVEFPQVFYFSSKINWKRISRALSIESEDDQKCLVAADAHSAADHLLLFLSAADESDGSCAERMEQSDSDEGREAEEEGEGREFWPIEWPMINFDE